SSQRLRTALSLDGEWLPAVLRQADERLRELRVDQPDAGGLVVATDQQHARGIADLLKRRLRTSAMVVTSDDPTASMRISAFADGDLPWLVAVRMVSEGVDIPRLRIGVFATTTGTELFFRQVVGRFVRHTGGPARQERAWLFIPDDPKIRHFAHTVAEQRRHSLRRVWEEGEVPAGEEPDPTALDELPGEEEQLSLFQVLSAEATEASTTSVWDDDPALDAFDEEDDTSVPIDLPPPPPPLGRSTGGTWSVADDGRPMNEIKRELRVRNADLVAHLVRFTGLSHQEVNARLNREVSISRIAEATADQLRLRAE